MKTNKSVDSWITTYTGRKFDFEHPEDFEFCVTDIALPLSRICRFGGNCTWFYSVAEHSVRVSEILPPELALAGLMHDADEAFVGDMVTPLKRMLPAYGEIERRIQREIFRQFGLPLEIPPEVKHADLTMLATEKRDLLAKHDDPWLCLQDISPIPCSIIPCDDPTEAYELFLRRFQELRPRER